MISLSYNHLEIEHFLPSLVVNHLANEHFFLRCFSYLETIYNCTHWSENKGYFLDKTKNDMVKLEIISSKG